MDPFTISIIADVIAGLTLAAVMGVIAMLRKFIAEQRDVNKANAMANRSLQRDVIYRYFHKIVECDEAVTPDEFEHLGKCAEAYFANDGNGVGETMWRKIQECVMLDTGRTD